MFTPFEWAVLALAAVGTTATIVQGEQEKDAAKKANKASQGKAAIENRRRRVEMIREQQAKAAKIENIQASSEAEGSGFSGSLGAMATDLASFQGDFSATQRLDAQRYSAMNDISRAQTLGTWGRGFQTVAAFGFQHADRIQAGLPKMGGGLGEMPDVAGNLPSKGY